MIFLLVVAGFASAVSQHTHSFVASGQGDLIMSGGTSVTRNPLECLRSGSPEQHSIAIFVLPLTPGVTLTRVSFAYRYTIGWGAPSPGNGTSFSLVVAKSNLYTSPQYNDYPYSKSRPNYSMPVLVNTPVSVIVPKTDTTRLELHFNNHDRNIQVNVCACVCAHICTYAYVYTHVHVCMSLSVCTIESISFFVCPFINHADIHINIPLP